VSAASWVGRLQGLAFRFSSLGIGPDLAGLTLAEAWAMYRLLRRLAGDVDG
jgi:hypothetical protein